MGECELIRDRLVPAPDIRRPVQEHGAVLEIAVGLHDLFRHALKRLFSSQQGCPFDICILVIRCPDLRGLCAALVFADECEEIRGYMTSIDDLARCSHRIEKVAGATEA